MPDRLAEIRDLLVKENDEYRRLFEKHHANEERLTALNSKVFLNDQEKVESTKLKKEKLLLKDRMVAIATEYLKRNPGVSGSH